MTARGPGARGRTHAGSEGTPVGPGLGICSAVATPGAGGALGPPHTRAGPAHPATDPPGVPGMRVRWLDTGYWKRWTHAE